METTSLKGLIQGMCGGEVSLLRGTVTSADPLKIKISGDDLLTITEANTYVPGYLTDYKTTVDISGGGDDATPTAGSHSRSVSGVAASTEDNTDDEDADEDETASGSIEIAGAEMTVYAALEEGEEVHVLSLAKGKLYYVLGRV